MLGAARCQGNERRQNLAPLSTPHVLRPERPRSGKSPRRVRIFTQRSANAAILAAFCALSRLTSVFETVTD